MLVPQALIPQAEAQSMPQTVQLRAGMNTGGTSFMDGFGRLGQGWTYIQYARLSHLDAIKDANGDDSPAFRDPKIDSTALITQFAYTSPYRLWGGWLGFNTLVPLVNLHASFADDSPATLRDNGFGLGDITFGPYLQMAPIIRQGRPVFSQRFEFDVIAPVGKFDRDRALNPGDGYWSILPNWAITVLPTPAWEISARFNYLYNFETDRAGAPPAIPGFEFDNGQAGDAAWVNLASSYAVNDKLRLGINGFYLRQLSDNRTNGERVADSRQTLLYLGPGGAYRFDADNLLNVNLYFPLKVENAAAGNSLNLQFVHSF
ncbi:transporter [Salinicola sp. JS01]|uniref:SphA family protein n=1 Tax=Salinicola sp. JS01 TaxID=3050071 RepID=UPI00255BD59B|nr:transporter [Salinicola sp. JS01]WIX33559.1 transporter [Salinicola sp. JS01]